MNYITSCPECDTHFLLNTEHIKSHRGKVQCGNCEHVFNAKNRLTEIPDDITSAEEYQASLDREADEANENVEDTLTDEIVIEAVDATLGEDASYIGEFNPDTASPDTEPALAEPEASDTDNPINTPTIFDDVDEAPSFSKKTGKSNVWPIILSMLLLFSAAAQATYFMRVKIAAEYPQFKPLLVDACQQLNCTIELPKNLDFITIGDSDMQEDENYEGVINFSSALTNNARYAQAYPNIALTLTNAEDQPVIKKLIFPKEYLAAGVTANNGVGAREEVHIKLAIRVSDEDVAGYRVLLVY